MDLDELRAFLAVAATGSISAAAKRDRTPRASLRRRLDELEARAGTALLHRTRDGATLTDAGAVLAKEATAILEQTTALLSSLREVGVEPAGTLRLLVPVGLPPAMLVVLFGAIRAAMPEIHIEGVASSDPLAERHEGFDAIGHFGEGTLGNRWITLRLLALREWLVASPAYLRARGRPESIEELAAHDLLGWIAPGRPTHRWPTLDDRTFAVRPIVVSADVHLVRHLAAAGHGIALLPDGELPDPAFPPGSLETVLSDRVGAVTSLCLSVPAVLADVPRVRRLLDVVRMFASAI